MTRFADGPGSSPGFLLWHVTLAWQRAVTTALAPYELTHVQFVLLACTWWLTEQSGPPTQVETARQAGADVRMTSQVLRTLEVRDLLTRTIDPADSRARRIRPTEAGMRLTRQAMTAVEEVDAGFFGPHAAAAVRLLHDLRAGSRPGS